MFELNKDLGLAKVAIYCRVSSEDQAERGTIESQVDAAFHYCKIHNISNYEYFKDDGITGTLPLEERPEGRHLLKGAANKEFDMVLVYKIDRLGRKTKIIFDAVQDLEQLGVKICSITEPFDTSTPIGSFMLNLFAGLAELDRSNILERLRLGTERTARLGKWLGGIVPYGYFVNSEGFLEIQEAHVLPNNISEADVVRTIYRLTVEEHWSTIKIADYLNGLEIPTSYTINGRSEPKGKRSEGTSGKWLPGRIRNMIVSTIYKGLHVYGKRSVSKRELISRAVPFIVPEDVWNKAQAVLKKNQIMAPRNAKHTYLLKSLIKCGHCGLSYSGTSYDGKIYYKCNGRQPYRGQTEKCSSSTINGDWLEDIVWQECAKFIQNPGKDLLKEFNTQAKPHIVAAPQSIEDEFSTLQQALKDKETKKNNLVELFLKSIITQQQLEHHSYQIQAEELAIKSRLEELRHQKKVIKFPSKSNDVKSLLSKIQKKLKKPLDLSIKQAIIRELVKSITVDESGVVKLHFMLGNINIDCSGSDLKAS